MSIFGKKIPDEVNVEIFLKPRPPVGENDYEKPLPLSGRRGVKRKEWSYLCSTTEHSKEK